MKLHPIIKALRSASPKVNAKQFEKDLAILRKAYKLPTITKQ